ncbi:MAG TPA: NnrS family protein [Geminicoccaceae bacterium]|nr:NnrS family protein [Geminicoccaceae bacterium]
MRVAGGIPRYRNWQGPALLRQGFRPFFLAAGLWAAGALLLWLAMLEGTATLPTAFDPLTWHAHEMLFGFAAAAVAGFLLTAVPNWTGRMPLQGVPLAGLVSLWLVGRVAVAFSDMIGPPVAAALDLAFLTVLLGAVLREILAGRSWRNLPICFAVTMLLLANALVHADVIGLAPTGPAGIRLGIAVMICLITLVGGRIIPSFTANWLRKRGETRLPASFGRFDQAAIALTIAALAAWTVAPEAPLTAAAALAAGLANTLRLARWRGQRTLAEPLVTVLHLGYAWVPIGLLLTGVGAFAPDLVPPVAGLHALTAGAIGTMTLAVMTRATLGHTGQALTAGAGTVAIYACVTLGALLRVIAPIMPDLSLLPLSGTLWTLAFLLFAALYGPLLCRAELGRAPKMPA